MLASVPPLTVHPQEVPPHPDQYTSNYDISALFAHGKVFITVQEHKALGRLNL